MKMTFTLRDDYTHLVTEMDLDMGVQGIPDSFKIHSPCYEQTTVYKLEFYSTDEVDCPECLKFMEESGVK